MKDKYKNDLNVLYVLVIATVLAAVGYLPLWGYYVLIGLGTHTIHKQMKWRKEVW